MDLPPPDPNAPVAHGRFAAGAPVAAAQREAPPAQPARHPREAAAPSGGRRVRKVSPLSIHFGTPLAPTLASRPMVWDSRSAINGLMLIAGPSGVGKTHRIRKIVRDLVQSGIRRVHLIDVAGDLVPDGLPASSVALNQVSRWGLSPLVISDHPLAGGPRARCNSFVQLLNRETHKIGPKQEAALRQLLLDLFDWRGFRQHDPRTWSLDNDPRENPPYAKRHATLGDLLKFTERKVRVMKLGGTTEAASAFDKVCAALRKLHSAGVQVQKGTKEEEELTVLKAAAVKTYQEALERLTHGREAQDLIKFSSADTLASLLGRLENLAASGAFRGEPPEFDPTCAIHHWDLSGLSRVEQQQATDVILRQIYEAAVQRGEADGVDEMIVLDEAHQALSDDPDHIVNILFRTIRKFGVGAVMASQHFLDFPPDVLTSAGVKVVLGTAEEFAEPMRKKLALDMVTLQSGRKANPLTLLKPRETAMVQVKAVGTDTPRGLIAVALDR